jgi:hypothetical protein
LIDKDLLENFFIFHKDETSSLLMLNGGERKSSVISRGWTYEMKNGKIAKILKRT